LQVLAEHRVVGGVADRRMEGRICGTMGLAEIDDPQKLGAQPVTPDRLGGDRVGDRAAQGAACDHPQDLAKAKDRFALKPHHRGQ
jgi:hypothetical protein